MSRPFLRRSSLWASVAVLLILASACTPTPAGKSRALPALEAQGMLRNDFAVLVDLREPTAGAAPQERAKQAIELPLSILLKEGPELTARLQSLPKGKTLAVFAETADLAKQGSERLAALGYQAGHLGTLEDWKKAGGPIDADLSRGAAR